MKKRIEELCLDVIDCPHSTPKWTANGKIVIRNFNIKNGKLDLSNPSYTTQEDYEKRIQRAKPEEGDIIITREAPMGEVCIVPPGLECCLGQRLVLLKTNKKICDSLYLMYAIMSPMVQNQIVSSGTGSVVANLRIPALKNLKIPYFDIDIQRNISKQLKVFDQRFVNNNSEISTLNEMLTAIYEKWFGKFISIKLQNEHGFKQDEISNVFSNIKEVKIKNKEERDYKVLSVVKEGEFKASEDVFTKQVYSKSTNNYKIVRRNQVAYNPARANIGSIAMLKEFDIGLVSPIYTVFEMKDTITPTFFYYYMKQPIFHVMIKHHAIGTTRQNFPFEAFKMFPMVVPPMELQLKFEEIAKPIEQKIAKLKEENEVLAEIRDTLLPKLMSGELPVKVGEN